MNKQEQSAADRKISLNSLIEDEEKENENKKDNKNIDNEDKNEKLERKNLEKRNAVDYTGQEINLNELIFE